MSAYRVPAADRPLTIEEFDLSCAGVLPGFVVRVGMIFEG